MSQNVRFAFAGDRDIAVWVLEYLLESGHEPSALLLSDPRRATHDDELARLCTSVSPEHVYRGKQFRSDGGRQALGNLDLDYIVAVHFPYVVPTGILDIPREGVLNLHPAYLPFNRGWHTPSWAILDDTPIGATLHFMAEAIDSGDIVHQESLEIDPGDTAHTLYNRIKKLELEVFKQAWPGLADGTHTRTCQSLDAGSSHVKQDLLSESVQRIELSEVAPAGELIRRLRALTTSDLGESAFYERDGKRYRVQIRIVKEP